MFMTEYDEKRHMAEEREEGREEGRKEGREEGRKEGREEGRQEGREEGRQEGIQIGIIRNLILLVKDGLLSLTTAAERAGMTVSEFEEKMKAGV